MNVRGLFSKQGIAEAARKVVVAFLGKESSVQREYDNPLRGLTVVRAVSLMESYNSGDFADLMWTFGAPFLGIENSDPDYLSILERRVGALKEMNFRVVRWKPGRDEKPDPVKEDLAQRSFDLLSAEYDRYENMKEAIGHMVLSKFRGFSILEPNPYEGEFVPLPHWNVRRDGMRGAWYFNESGTIGADLSTCKPFFRDRIIVMESARPIGRIALLKYIRANLSEKEWDRFVEIYGVPAGIVIAPDSVTQDKLAAFRAAAASAAKGADTAFPSGTQYVPNDQPRGIQPFQARLEWLSQKLVQAGTGGYLTMLSMSGSGTLAGSAHMEAFRILARADAADVTEAFQAQFDKPLLRAAGLLQPGRQPLAWFEISSREEQSTKEAADQVVAMSQHYDLDPMQVEERTGWKVTKKAQPALPAGGMFRALPASAPHRTEEPAYLEGSDMAAAIAEDLAPFGARLDELLEEEGDDFKAAAARLLEELPELAKKALADPKAAELIEEAMLNAAGLDARAAKGLQNGREGKGA